MYIQITTRCNMRCDHCCYSCGPEGADMSKEVFVKACELAEEYGHIISLGGGEPTIHPLFWEFLGLTLAYNTDEAVPWMAINGKETETALKLAKLARKGVISVELSTDEYHERIDGDVTDAFHQDKRGEYLSGHSSDFRGTRDVTLDGMRDPLPFGRAADWSEADRECVCNDLFVAPDGVIWACGCQKISYGTVYAPQLPDEWPDEWCSEDY